MDPIVVVAIILGILVVLFVLDWRLNRNRSRPGREAPPSAAEVDHEQHPHQGRFLPPFTGGGGGGSGSG
jgi:hypothetical protein